MNAKSSIGVLIGIVLVLAVVVLLYSTRHNVSPTAATPHVLQVVAAENFWGSLIAQLGGTHVQVLSIVSDPNADPHEYEASANDARAIATASYVIENGAGYDSWMDKLLAANPNTNRAVLNVANLVGKKDGDNPHFWYSPTYVNEVVSQMEQNLITLDPADAAYYEAQYASLQASLSGYQNRIQSIQQQFGGTDVASTESIFVYLAQAAGLNLISPPAFIDAVAEGNDPPAASIVMFQNQLVSGQVHLMVYNEQTVTPLTTSMKARAASAGIPIVGLTETIQPPDTPFQDWMNAQIISLQHALMTSTSTP
jgi:zinc/manganese transport system substrate-binding protein